MNLSAIDILNIIKTGQLSPVTLTEMCLRKAAENRLNEFITILEERAMLKARESFNRVRNGNTRPLEGLPISIKDIFCMKGELTTAGSKILSNFRPPYTASIIQFLEEAGAIIVGKTNMDEFAMGSSGENSAFGNTINPLDESRVAGGSSSGSAASVANYNVFASFGSDTGGSVRLPASFCGIVGFKPSYGALSRHGMIAFASSFDHPAIFTRTVADARLIASIAGQVCSFDSNYQQVSFQSKPLSKLKFAYIPEQIETVSTAVRNMFYNTLESLRSKGHEAQPLNMSDTSDWLKLYYTITPAEACSNLAKYDCMRFGSTIKADNIDDEYLEARKLFGDEVKKRIVLGADILHNRMEDFHLAVKYRHSLISRFDTIFSSFDAIISPTATDIAFKIGEMQNSAQEYAQDVLTVLANIIMAPAVSIPRGFDQKMPLGLTIMCKRGYDGKTLDIAEYIERIKYA